MAHAAPLAFLFVIGGLTPCRAEDTPAKTPETNSVSQPDKKPETKEQRTLERYGVENKSCLEWSDGCAVCMRQAGEAFACSLPGIACEPTSLSCRSEKKHEPPPEPSEK